MTSLDALPCRKCGKPHQQRIAHGGGRTWADPNDGHAYDRYNPETAPAPVGQQSKWGNGDGIVRLNRPGWRSSFFGALLTCDRCGTVRDPAHRDLVVGHESECHKGGAA